MTPCKTFEISTSLVSKTCKSILQSHRVNYTKSMKDFLTQLFSIRYQKILHCGFSRDHLL